MERLDVAPYVCEALRKNPNDVTAQEHALLLIAMFEDCHEYVD